MKTLIFGPQRLLNRLSWLPGLRTGLPAFGFGVAILAAFGGSSARAIAPDAQFQRAFVASAAASSDPKAAFGKNGAVSPLTKLDPIDLALNSQRGSVVMPELPDFTETYEGRFAHTVRGTSEIVLYTVDPALQRFASELVRHAEAPHVAIVAMDPRTGRILALAQKSRTIPNLAMHAGFPAASLFKIVTAAAAIQEGTIKPDTEVHFRGGTYVLERWNYMPDPRRDRKSMSVSEALGKSCNAVFGRIGFNFLSAPTLLRYADAFGFNEALPFERRLATSAAVIPSDSYDLSRTAAGFGAVNISAVHAAALMSGLANGGLMPKPYIVEEILSENGKPLYLAKPEMYRRMVEKRTASALMQMMLSTTTKGTSRREFMNRKSPVLGSIEVSAKTGTLTGDDPPGKNHWFIAAAPRENPKIALAVITVDPRSTRAHSSRLGRLMIQKYLLD